MQSYGSAEAPAIDAPAAPALQQSNATDEALRQAKLDAAHAFLMEIGMTEVGVQEFRTWCQGEGRPWVTLALNARDSGEITAVEQFYEWVRE